MTSPSRIGRIADDAISQMVAQSYFTTGAMNSTGAATPEFCYEYDFDIPTTNLNPQVIVAPLDLTPTRQAWGEEQTKYGIGFAVVRRVADITDRSILDPSMECVEHICQYLLGPTKFDTTAYCVSANAIMGVELSSTLRQNNLFLVVIEAVFQDNLNVNFST